MDAPMGCESQRRGVDWRFKKIAIFSLRAHRSLHPCRFVESEGRENQKLRRSKIRLKPQPRQGRQKQKMKPEFRVAAVQMKFARSISGNLENIRRAIQAAARRR